jgi:hypothetical protein
MTHPLPCDSRRSRRAVASALATWLALAGCNRATPEPSRPAPAPSDAPAPTTATPSRPRGPTGAVEGVVRLTGSVPAPQPVVIDADVARMRGCAESARGYYANPFGVTAPGPLPSALVSVDTRGLPAPPPRRRYATFHDCAIEPRLLAMGLNDTLVLHATTDAHHLTKVDGLGATIAQMLMPNEDQEKHVTRPGRYILHSVLFPHWMQTPIIVSPQINWYYDQTNAAGRYRIEGLPPGTYTVHAWFPNAGTADASVTVTAGATAQQDFALSPLPPSEIRPPGPPPDAGPVIP